MTDLGLAALAAALLSAVMEYVPGFSDWFQALSPQGKKLSMGLSLVVSAVVLALLACHSPYQAVACSAEGFWGLAAQVVLNLGLMIGVNQGTHDLIKRPSAD